MATTSIPLVTLPVGSRTFGPHSATNTESSVTLSIDRGVTNGLNSLTLASQIAVDVQQSNDGGATWIDLGTWTAPGSAITWTDRQGVQHVYTVSSGTWPLLAGTSRKLQATVTVSGPSPIAVSGSISTV